MRLSNLRHWLWAASGMLVLIAVAALIVLSVTALRADRAEAEARLAAAVEENLRLALWRIDTAWAPLVAQEGLRPVAGYASAALDRSQPLESQSDLPVAAGAPSQLAIVDRFEWSPGRAVPDRQFEASELSTAIDFPSLWQRLPSGTSMIAGSFADSQLGDSQLGDSRMHASRSAVEFQNRSQAILANNALMQQVTLGNQHPATFSDPGPPPLVAIWDCDQMLLVRRAQHRGEEILQGCSLDWHQLRRWSLDLIADLLPEATLEPVAGLGANGGPDMLAALPVRLIPGSLAELNRSRRFSVPLILAVAWTAVLLAAALGVVLLCGVLQLSERRAAFVSAVTHELRTPLTTFQLYTEMLSSGMITDEATRRSYLDTLRAEALRLNHLVDNVLAYARLERGRPVGPIDSMTLGAMLHAVQPQLEQLAQRNEMTVVVMHSESFDRVVRVNVSIVEQILLNLVDNACKYAGGAVDRRILISAETRKCHVELRVCDYGPGLPAGGQWLRPFSKSAHQAAESSPGIGLGLALSRRLARQIGGSLRPGTLAEKNAGACLVLQLPLVTMPGLSKKHFGTSQSLPERIALAVRGWVGKGGGCG